MRIVCQQTILMKYHALLLFLKKRQIFNCRLLQIIGDAFRVNTWLTELFMGACVVIQCI